MSFGKVSIVGFSGEKYSGKNSAAAYLADALLERGTLHCAPVLLAQMAFADPLKRVLALLTGVPVTAMHDDAGKAAPCPRARAAEAYAVCDAMFGDLRPAQWAAADAHLTTCIGANMGFGADGVRQRVPKALKHFDVLQQREPDMSVGRALQLLGTECFRDFVSDCVWIACMSVRLMFLTECARISPMHVHVLITDARFPNELAWLRQQSGLAVNVVRPKERRAALVDGRDAQHGSERALDGATFDAVIFNDGTLADLRASVRLLVERLGAASP